MTPRARGKRLDAFVHDGETEGTEKTKTFATDVRRWTQMMGGWLVAGIGRPSSVSSVLSPS